MSGFAKDLSVIIPGRNEEWHAQTVEDVLAHSHSDAKSLFQVSWVKVQRELQLLSVPFHFSSLTLGEQRYAD